MEQNASLAGRVVLVTGAAGTLGQAISLAIGRHGGMALRTDIDKTDAIDLALDVTSEADWMRAAQHVDAAFGRLDGLVNNAGIIVLGDVERTTYRDWRRVQAVNVDGTFLGCKYMLPLLARADAASIVNMSSVSGLVGGANLAAYNASKGAVRLLTKSVALSGARKVPPVRCNSLHPSFVEGDMVDTIAASARDSARAYATMQAASPLQRLGRADEIAEAAVFLLSDASAFMTGAELVIDGGLTAQ